MACEDLPILEAEQIEGSREQLRMLSTRLENDALNQYKQFLCGMGQYILHTPKVEIDDLYILEMNRFLNDLAAKAEILGWPPINEIDDMIGLSNELAELVNRGVELGITRGRSFATLGNELARKLITVGDQ